MKKYRKPFRIKKRKSVLKNKFFWLGILIFAVLGGAFYFLAFHSFFQIKEISISNNEKVSTENLEDLVRVKTSQQILFFSSQSIFSVNFIEIQKAALNNFPQLEEINFKREFPDKILVQVKERKPAAVFCSLLREEEEEEEMKCFLIDKEGIIFETAERWQDYVLIKKDPGRQINLGEKVMEKERLSQVLETELKLKTNLGIQVKEIFKVSEIRFDVKTFEGWQIYFNFQEDLDWQLTKLRAVLSEEISQERRKDLEYIDVRFGNFAPYKYRD